MKLGLLFKILFISPSHETTTFLYRSSNLIYLFIMPPPLRLVAVVRRRAGCFGQIRRHKSSQVSYDLLHGGSSQGASSLGQVLSRRRFQTRLEHLRDERRRSHSQSSRVQPARAKVGSLFWKKNICWRVVLDVCEICCAIQLKKQTPMIRFNMGCATSSFTQF